MLLEGKVAVVTGGASGIGRATCVKFAREGASVVVADVDEAGGAGTVEAITADGGRAVFVRTDVSVFEQVEAVVERAVDEYGTIDIIFNNAGIGAFNPLLDSPISEYDRIVKVNQYGVYYGIVAAGRKMRALGVKGVIINTASVFAFMGTPFVIHYHASKGAVKMMTQAAAVELSPLGIRCIAIAPGGVNTPIIQTYKDMGMEDMMKKQHMSGRLQEPEDIANAVALLASADAAAINGSVVMVDDGWAEFKM